MAVREFKSGDCGGMSVGRIARSATSKSHTKLTKAVVYPGESYCHVTLGFRDEKSVGQTTIGLTSSAAMEMVKGILLNLSDVTIAVDDELLKIVQGAKARADADAEAMVRCLKERHTPTESK